MKTGVLMAALIGMTAQAGAEPLAVQVARYGCDRGVEVPATYVTGPEDAIVVIHVEGRQIVLYQEPAGSGARYGWPSDGAGYVWWTKADTASLYWREAGRDGLLLGCTALK